MTEILQKINPSKIGLAGDWHGNSSYGIRAFKNLVQSGAEVVIQLGDFGIWPREDDSVPMVNALEQVCKRTGVPLLFIDGNHEHHDFLDSLTPDDSGVSQLSEHIFHLRRGTVWEWRGVSFLAFGGARSIDKQWRTEGVDWFPQEVYTVEEANEAIANANSKGLSSVDVLLTHDYPSRVAPPFKSPFEIPKSLRAELERDNAILGGMVDLLTPRFQFHGHLHVSYREVRPTWGGRSTEVIGLDMDGRPYTESTAILDLEKLSGRL